MKNCLYLLLALIMGCTASSMTNLTEADSDRIIPVSLGEEVSIALSGNMTTGYSWQFSSDKPAHSVVLKDIYITNKHPTGMVGVGGKSIYQIKIMKAGKFTITAQYYRPWEKFDSSRDKHLEFVFEAK